MSSESISTNESVIACDLNAIAADQKDQHGVTVRELFSAVQEAKELSDGYAFRLPSESAILIKAAEFIANERLCCPFFEFSIVVTANGGPIWLQLAGNDEVKKMVRAEFGALLSSTVA